MSERLYQCSCPHCTQNLEYYHEYSGRVIDCPACQKPLTLPEIPFEPPVKRNLVGDLFSKLRERVEFAKDKRALRDMLLEAVKDGVLTASEIEQIRAFMNESGLNNYEIQNWSVEIFQKAVSSLNAETASHERLNSIEAIKRFLDVDDMAVTRELQWLDRIKYLLRIRSGVIPTIQLNDLILRNREVAYWVQPSRLWENRVVNRRYEGGSVGVSFRIAKGITLRTGGTRGKLVVETADQVVAEGQFIITSQRFIFQGDHKSFESKFDKLLGIHNHVDGICYSESNKQKPRKIEYLEPNGDIIVEILNQIFGPNKVYLTQGGS